MIQVRIIESYLGGIGIAFLLKSDDASQPPMVLHLTTPPAGKNHDGSYQPPRADWEPVPDTYFAQQPTLMLDEGLARALADALVAHYQGASDMRQVRADLLHARDRLDKVTDTALAIAADLAGRSS